MGLKGYIKRKKVPLIVAAVFVAAFGIYYAYMSYVTARTEFMENTVKNSMNISLRVLLRDSPRCLYTVVESGKKFSAPSYYDDTEEVSFYAPDLMNEKVNSDESGKIYFALLEAAQDDGIPYCKIYGVALYGEPIPQITATASVKFPLFPGINTTVSVTSEVTSPEYKNSTGVETISG